jgi:hypothetical protein
MSAKNKWCTLDNGSVPTASRPRQAVGEILVNTIKSGRNMSSDVLATLKNQFANKLKFLWVMVEQMDAMGFSRAKDIEEALKRQRSYEEKLRRHAEKNIETFTNLYKRNRKAAEALQDVGWTASESGVNPFMPRNRYLGRTELLDYEGKKVSEVQLWDILNADLAKISKLDAGAPLALKSIIDSFQFYRKEYARATIQAIKDRAGEGNLKDDETSPNVYEQIKTLKDGFARADNDAYLTLLRTGKYVVNTYRMEGLGEDGVPARVLDESRSFEDRSEAREYADQKKQELKDPSLIDEFIKTDINAMVNGNGRSALNSFFDKVRPALDKLKPTVDVGDPGYETQSAMIENFKERMKDAALLLYPETSIKKQLISKRKNVQGYNRDLLKTYAIMSDRYSNQIAKIRYNASIDVNLGELQQEVISKTRGNRDMNEKANALLNEIAQHVVRFEAPPSALDRFAAATNQLGFMWFLGLNPSSALINMSQVPGVTLPWLSARFPASSVGQLGVSREMIKAYRDVTKFKGMLVEGTISERVDELMKLDDATLRKDYNLTKDEVKMFAELDELGALRSGMQIYDINSIADKGSAYPGSMSHGLFAFQKFAGFAFQKVELINREVSALMAYRLAKNKAMIGKDKPLNTEEAVKFAEQTINKTQGLYSNDQAPAPFMNPALKVILMFKKFPAHMATLYVLMFRDIFKGADPSVRRVARRQFTRMMGMTGLMAGVAGMPLYYIIRDIMNAMLGDEDDPYNFDLELRRGLIEQLGPTVGNMIFSGIPGQSGLGIGQRLGYEASFLLGGTDVGIPFVGGVLGLQDVRRAETLKEEVGNIMFSLLGPAGGIVDGLFRGYDYMEKGDVYRGIESMMPAFLRNPLKAGRFATEGALTARGDALVEDISTLETLGQFFGFSPQRLVSQYSINQGIKDIEQDIMDRRKELLEQYAYEVRTGDRAGQQEVLAEIREFSKVNPYKGVAITQDTISRSLRRREDISDETRNGIRIAKGLEPRVRELRAMSDDPLAEIEET